MVSLFDRAGSLARGLRRKSASKRSRRDQDRRLRTAIDQLESRLALAITTPLEIGGTTVGSFTDTPTGPGTIGDFVTVSIEGTRGTVIFNGGKGVADGTDIQTIEIVDASPDFQLTFNGVVRTANPVPYGSDGIIQMGTITTANVIRGINTVRGPAANVAVAYTPYGFTQSGGDIGSANISLTGDVTGTFVGGAPGTFVVATPLLPSAGTPVFTTVSTSVYNGGTGNTAITLADATGAGTTAGALTTAEVRNVEFQLTKFVGVNFSNRTLKEGGGLFVDTVLGDGEPAGDTLPANVGILLSQGLLAYSTIGIRKELQAAVVLGTTRSASVDGRMFVESATEGAEIFVGPQTFPTAKNSTFELVGGEGVFSANVIVAQAFQGVINLQAEATGNVLFLRGVGSRARLNADSWSGVIVNGDFAGQINATGGDIALGVSGNLTSSARINAYSDVSLAVGGSVLKGAAIAASDITFAIAGNLLGNVLSGNDLSGIVGGNVSGSTITVESDATLAVGGSILNSTIAADNDLKLGVVRSVTGSRFHVSEDGPMSVAVGGNVSKSRFTASSNDEEAPPDSLSLLVAGSLTDSTVVGEENVEVSVAGAVTRTQFASTESNVSLEVGGVISSSRLTAGDDVELNAARDATGITVLAQAAVSLAIGGNWSGTAQSANSDIRVDVAGSVLKGSSFAGYNGLIDVGGNFDGSVTASDLRFFVRGNVSMASRITAQRVTDWADEGGPNFAIGGRLDGPVQRGPVRDRHARFQRQLPRQSADAAGSRGEPRVQRQRRSDHARRPRGLVPARRHAAAGDDQRGRTAAVSQQQQLLRGHRAGQGGYVLERLDEDQFDRHADDRQLRDGGADAADAAGSGQPGSDVVQRADRADELHGGEVGGSPRRNHGGFLGSDEQRQPADLVLRVHDRQWRNVVAVHEPEPDSCRVDHAARAIECR
jgi:cytoskeletal protein CcmA (bactofilin family)